MSASPVSPASPCAGAVAPLLGSPLPPCPPAALRQLSASESIQAVLLLQHSDRVPPAYVSTFLQGEGVPFHVLRVDLPEEETGGLPAVEQPWRAIVSLGGPQGSYEGSKYPYLAAEKSFLLAHIQRHTPVLGICLGCQLLADAVGGQVYAAEPEQLQVGYKPIALTEEGMKDPLLSEVFQRLGHAVPPASPSAAAPTASSFLLHHGDTFHLPPSIPVLALSSSGFKQAFRYGSAFAVQFHPESGLSEMEKWTGWNPSRYVTLGTTREEVLRKVEAEREEARRHTQAFFEVWWKQIKQQQQQQQTCGTNQ